ncbi:unnamed protein product [Cyprideis torosa]|uniref:Uncharacterized protein n=1 Tax=Cyprideis torosa TaxID=163714 RepID=A0A7R8WS51_9CRUS|nr:unnamed protein product [Cyprideis torosa]CAG0907425.1 unnamed protein product [Cyprideis torosa]
MDYFLLFSLFIVFYLTYQFVRIQASPLLLFYQKFGVEKKTYFMNKVIWITGASSGLGRAIAVEIASLCRCKLVLSGLEGDWLEEVKKECLGIGVAASVHTGVYESMERKAFQINYFAATSLTRCVLPHMRERNSGHIVFTSSILGHVVSPAASTYAATKHAILVSQLQT